MSVPTSSIPFMESEHGRLRRAQRGIDKKDLQRAIKYGDRVGAHPRPNGDQTAKYTYRNITYIVNEVTGQEITAYAKPLELDCVPISRQMEIDHEEAEKQLQEDLNCWTSNCVMVVDTSGSMRESDMWGTRNRLGAVWVSVALDYLAHRIETGEAFWTDVLTVVTLDEKPRIVLKEQPSTWVLYNQIVQIYSNDYFPARGHGLFLPSLTTAESLLVRNSNASCAAALLFLSDGKPSDLLFHSKISRDECENKIVRRVERLAEKFGGRLTFKGIGIGDHQQDFTMIQRMVAAAKDYGAKSSFERPSMASSSLGGAFSSVAASISATQSEMTNQETGRQYHVRPGLHESRKKAREKILLVTETEFYIYPEPKVVRTIYEEWFEERKKKYKWGTVCLQHPHAKYVALAKKRFGEGGERYAFRFYEVAADKKTILGLPLVAKESRLILEQQGDERARLKFVRTFCTTQQLAGRLADEFNAKLDSFRRVHPSTPRISFLDCSVYELDDMEMGKQSVLVEERLDETEWHKWNCNNGRVEGMERAPTLDHASMQAAFTMIEPVIEEGSDEEDDQEDETNRGSIEPKVFTAAEVAQAFSHFTYWASGRKRLVCDLQGVHDKDHKMLRLSDPVIHYWNENYTERRRVHGLTDRGRAGIADFFATHQCGHLCKLMLRGFKRGAEQQSHRSKR